MQLEQISFHGDLLWAGREGGNVLVAVKPICDNLSLDWVSQLKRIKRDEILSKGMVIMTIPSPGGAQETCCLPLSLIAGWVFGIDDRRIPDETVRAKVLDYKRECHEVLYRHFFGERYVHDTHTFVDDDGEDAQPIPMGTHRWLSEVAMVRECRRIHGVTAARAMWAHLGLPQVPEMSGLAVSGVPPLEDIELFLAECCTDVPGHRTRTMDLWQAYLVWCKAQGRVPSTLNMFGRTLSARYRKVKASVAWYIGIALMVKQ